MKKFIALIIAVACFSVIACAQTRKMTAAEIQYYNHLHQALYDAMPHTFKDWTVVEDGSKFDATKYFCPISVEGHDCTGMCNVSLGKSEQYQLIYSADYAMPSDQSDAMAAGVAGSITNYNDATQVAAALKGAAKCKLHIEINANVYTPGSGSFVLVNCPKVPVQTLSIPVPSTLAVLGVRSGECPYMRDGHVNLSPGGDGYYDDAVVFLGKPVAFKQNDSYSDGYTHTSYGIGFDKAKIGIPVVQNIMVSFKGDADDIKGAIQQIDWQKLNALLAK